MARSSKRSASQNQLRVIGGQWRGRKLSFTPAAGLRPTPDRVRETLFNWLSGAIKGARCADLFAGSGALGLEALSRGAASVDFVDSSVAVIAQINDHLSVLSATALGQCHTIPAEQFLGAADTPYDIVFIDPPFNQQLVESACSSLASGALLQPNALVYVEMSATESPPTVPDHWILHRDKTAGEVAYRLYAIGDADSPV